LSFYFWLDVVSTLSMITDISWIMNAILGTGTGSVTNAKSASNVARASRGARVGSKAGRIARVIRLIRLIRIVKLYKSANTVLADNDDKEQLIAEIEAAQHIQQEENAETVI